MNTFRFEYSFCLCASLRV